MERIAREREVKQQTLLTRIAWDREAVKRDAPERESHLAQQQAAAERETIERKAEEERAEHELKVRRRAKLHEQALAQQASYCNKQQQPTATATLAISQQKMMMM